MIITRLQVEEGFLDKLDLEFQPGLNVVIGPRGTGKTSIIELLRFALGVPGHTEKISAKATAHAKAVLGSGRVTVVVQDGRSEIVLTRSADDPTPRLGGFSPAERPAVLSQSEIEEVGVTPAGRLNLIDAFRPAGGSGLRLESAIAAEIASVTSEMRELSSEVERLREVERANQTVPDELKFAHAEEANLLSKLGEAGPDRERLGALTERLAAAAVRNDAIVATYRSIRTEIDRVGQLAVSMNIVEPWPPGAGEPDLLGGVRKLADRARQNLQETLELLEQALQEADAVGRGNREQQVRDEDESRTIRTRLEGLQSGAGAVTRKLSDLAVRQSQLTATRTAIADRRGRLTQAERTRESLLDELDRVRDERFEARLGVAQALNANLGPRVRIELRRYGQPVGYQEALAAALRGSGLQYNTLAPFLAQHLSPRELASIVESGDTALLSQVSGLAADRAQRLVEHLRGQHLETILTAAIEDDVELQLLDGDEYKPTSRLSTGQRCTVVLPILLSHPSQLVVVDQPEDHLDNAFVVDTVVRAIIERSPTSQTILATHNANIPVLGEASLVIYLGSTGERGFVRAAKSLDDAEIVEAITNVMEGGADAFRKRATFYHLA